MFKYLVLFALGSPLIGILLMETGSYGWSVARYGHQNGATAAFSGYCLIVIACSLFFRRRSGRRLGLPRFHSVAEFRSYSVVTLALLGIIWFILLFWFGGIEVYRGTVGKSEFRVNLGSLGAIAYWVTKFVVPGLVAYGACLYAYARRRYMVDVMLWWSTCVTAFLIGSVWGFKATGLLVLLPAVLIRYWRLRSWQLLTLSAGAVAVMSALYVRFDIARTVSIVPVLKFLWYRATVLQGDVAWYVWDQYKAGQEFPSYWKTLWSIGGGKLLSAVTGVKRGSSEEWAQYHYDYLLNSVAGIPNYVTASGHNVTATPFAEGVIAAGVPGMVGLAIVAGVVVGLTGRHIGSALQHRRYTAAALLATYFCWVVFPWLNGGGVHQLVHVATFMGMMMTYVAIIGVRYLVTATRRSPGYKVGGEKIATG